MWCLGHNADLIFQQAQLLYCLFAACAYDISKNAIHIVAFPHIEKHYNISANFQSHNACDQIYYESLKHWPFFVVMIGKLHFMRYLWKVNIPILKIYTMKKCCVIGLIRNIGIAGHDERFVCTECIYLL